MTGNAASATKIYRNGINKGATDSYRVLLGTNSNNAGNSNTYVVTDEARLYYQPSTNRIAGLATISGKADNSGQLNG